MKHLLNITLLCLALSQAQPAGAENPLSDEPQSFAQSYYYENLGQYSKAISVLLAIYQEDSYEINVRLAWLNYLNGAYTESTSYYQKAITLMPLSLEAKFGYVLPASAVGNWESVVARYQEILRIDPKNQKANYRLASIHYNREEYSEAYRLLKRIVNLYPFQYDYLILYAWTNLKLGKSREARVLFRKVLWINAKDESALKGLEMLP